MPTIDLPIAIVLSLSYSYCRQVLRGIRQYVRGKDWMLYPILPQQNLRSVLRQLKPAGVIAYASNREIAQSLQGLRKPIVNVSRADPKLPFPQVNIEEERIGSMAAEHLMNSGLRHFGFFGPSRYGPDSGREGGFYRALKRIAHTVDTCHVQSSSHNPGDSVPISTETTRNWIRKLPKPAGVFTTNDSWSLWLSDVCRQERIRVPDDIAIIGVDNDELLCEVAQPSLSSVSIPAERVTYQAAALLDELLGGAPIPAEPKLLPPLGVVARQSTDLLKVDDPDLAAAIRYIREHVWEPISIANVVDSVAVSRRSLERKFRSVLGHSPTEEIQRLRIGRAKSLLETTDLKMPQIALRSGFSSAKQLSTVFHQATGTTPSVYRRQVVVSGGGDRIKPNPKKSG